MECNRGSDMADQSNHHGVLNELTDTIHERKEEATHLQATCGALRHVRPEQLHSVLIEDAVIQDDVTRCGRCFDDGGGY